MPLDAKPGAAQDQNVGPAVVVVIGLHDVESPGLPDQPGFFSAVGEGPLAVVVEIAHLIAHPERRNHDVQIAVPVEVFDNCTAREGIQIQPEIARDIVKSGERIIRFEGLGWDQPLGGHALRVFAQRHGRDVEEPARLQIIREFVELLGQKLARLARAALDFVNALAANRH